jgi:hypothetical protein
LEAADSIVEFISLHVSGILLLLVQLYLRYILTLLSNLSQSKCVLMNHPKPAGPILAAISPDISQLAIISAASAGVTVDPKIRPNRSVERSPIEEGPEMSQVIRRC